LPDGVPVWRGVWSRTGLLPGHSLLLPTLLPGGVFCFGSVTHPCSLYPVFLPLPSWAFHGGMVCQTIRFSQPVPSRIVQHGPCAVGPASFQYGACSGALGEEAGWTVARPAPLWFAWHTTAFMCRDPMRVASRLIVPQGTWNGSVAPVLVADARGPCTAPRC